MRFTPPPPPPKKKYFQLWHCLTWILSSRTLSELPHPTPYPQKNFSSDIVWHRHCLDWDKCCRADVCCQRLILNFLLWSLVWFLCPLRHVRVEASHLSVWLRVVRGGDLTKSRNRRPPPHTHHPKEVCLSVDVCVSRKPSTLRSEKLAALCSGISHVKFRNWAWRVMHRAHPRPNSEKFRLLLLYEFS